MRVIVTGGRDYQDKEVVWGTLDRIHREGYFQWQQTVPVGPRNIVWIITGACPYGGADLLAENWAKENEVNYIGYPAKFKTGPRGKAEGPYRNAGMAEYAEASLVVAFPGGRGTANMIAEAKIRGIPILLGGT